jgi:hypothetical protein
MTEDEFEPARRELCSDDSCIGLVGPDGRCKVCGVVAPSAVADPRHSGMRSPREFGDGEGAAELDEERELCPDGTCVGIIGPDALCKVCGAKGPGAAMQRTARARPIAHLELDAAEADSAGGEGVLEVDEDEDRELCPDGACVGLIGSDGRCKVCGTPRSSSP